MLAELYSEFLLDESQYDPDSDVTLKIDSGNLPKTQKVSKKMDEETQEKIRDENDKIRIERKALVEPIAERISTFKVNFISAPIRRAFKAALEGK